MKEMIGKLFRIIFSLLLCVALVWGVWLQISPDKATIWNYSFNIIVACIYLMGGVLSYRASKKNEGGLKKFFLFFSFGMISWGIASISWAFSNVFLHSPIPYPSFPDIFYLLFSFCIGLGFWYLLDVLNISFSRTNLRDALIITLVVYFAIFFEIYKPDYSLDLPITTIVVNYAYPFSTSFLLTLSLVILRMVEKKNNLGIWFIAVALAMQTAGDVIFSSRVGQNIYFNGDLSDMLYLMSGGLLGYGILILKDYYKLKANNNSI